MAAKSIKIPWNISLSLIRLIRPPLNKIWKGRVDFPAMFFHNTVARSSHWNPLICCLLSESSPRKPHQIPENVHCCWLFPRSNQLWGTKSRLIVVQSPLLFCEIAWNSPIYPSTKKKTAFPMTITCKPPRNTSGLLPTFGWKIGEDEGISHSTWIPFMRTKWCW